MTVGPGSLAIISCAHTDSGMSECACCAAPARAGMGLEARISLHVSLYMLLRMR